MMDESDYPRPYGRKPNIGMWAAAIILFAVVAGWSVLLWWLVESR